MPTSRKSPCNEHELASKRQRTLLMDFVKRSLSSEERLIVTLHYCEAMSLNEIAAVLRKPFEYVSERHTHIQNEVRQQLGPAQGEQVRVA